MFNLKFDILSFSYKYHLQDITNFSDKKSKYEIEYNV